MKEILDLGLRLALICGVAALLLSQVDAQTREPIRLAMLAERMEAVAAVMPPFDNVPDADRVDLGDAASARSYWRGYQGEAPAGVAFKALTSAGYSGEIELMLGVDAEGKVSGLRILRHAETPGLGAKYADPATLTQLYAGRALTDTDWRVKKDGGDLDAVTGATVTGRALAGAISAALTQYAEDQAQLAAAPRGAGADSSGAEVAR